MLAQKSQRLIHRRSIDQVEVVKYQDEIVWGPSNLIEQGGQNRHGRGGCDDRSTPITLAPIVGAIVWSAATR